MLTTEDFQNPYTLARLADCATPDNKQSPGAAFLLDVADDYRRAAEDRPDTDPDDLPYDIADEATLRLESRGSHGLILAAVDLCAYSEDIDDLAEPTTDAHRLLTLGLYVIAERLIRTLQAETEEN